MWIFINDAFFSIVQDESNHSNLLVRSRFSGDITNVFPDAKVLRTPHRDYLYRTTMPRKTVEDAIASEIARINYPNFKDSVEDKPRAIIYSKVWDVMFRAQEITQKILPMKKKQKKALNQWMDKWYGTV
jgi:hypothetical protein